MTDLISALRAFNKAYAGDPDGMESDFALVTGFTIQELTDRLMDEVDQLKED